ncbi:MAG: ABC transporter ATP-binding protein [Rickettsiales bacterium]|jgi:ABC-2 type transport system ATP-binding protein|nr:ABC transporter ATP-binding protein [Rickettsiales bacterium]
MLEVINLTKVYNGEKVLDNINFTVEKGETFCLLGLNGVGKTTLIKCILSLLKMDGIIKLDGEINNVSNTMKKIGYLPENFCPNQVLTGIEFLNFFNVFTSSELSLICDLLYFDKQLLNKKICQYSKGSRQKLGLLSIFLNKDTNLFILDEPLNNLDQLAILSFEKLLKNKKTEQSIFFTTHIINIANICDKIAILDNGKIIFLDAPSKLKEIYNENNLEKAFLKSIIKN